MNGGTLVTAIWAANLAATALYLRVLAGTPDVRWRRFGVLTAVTGLVASLIAGNWVAAGFCVATLALLLRDWWRRRGRKVAKLVGAKSRAVLAAIVEKAREAGSPLPSPEGVRA